MLVYISVYVLAAVLVFQGVNLLVERKTTASVVPAEVKPAPAWAFRWGLLLVIYGGCLALTAIMSHGCTWLASGLTTLRCLGLAIMAAYGLWLVFGGKVNYTPAPPSKEAHGH